MNAVLNKPRAKVTKRSTTAPAKKDPLAELREAIALADEKLEMAYEAAEPGEYVDTLIDHVCHGLLGDAVRPLQSPQVTQADSMRVYRDLFPVLACLQGAIKLAEGTVLTSTLEEAFAILDAAQNALDSATETVRALPPGHDRSHELTTEEVSDAGLDNELPAIQQHPLPGQLQDPVSIMTQALEVMLMAAVESGSDVMWGLHALVENGWGDVDQAHRVLREAGKPRTELHDKASETLAGVLGVLRAVQTEHGELVGAVATLVTIAKLQLDEDNAPREEAQA